MFAVRNSHGRLIALFAFFSDMVQFREAEPSHVYEVADEPELDAQLFEILNRPKVDEPG